MNAAAVHAAIEPDLEGDFVLPDVFPLEAGGVLRHACLRYAVYGQMNEARDNVVLVCHALSGSARVGDWWPAMFASDGLIRPAEDVVVGVNVLGSCYGSTGPASVNQETGKRYGASFPLIQIADVVRAQALLLESLGVARVRLAIGASLGGMQVLSWAIQFPSRVDEVLAIGAAPLNALGLAQNHLQRQAIMLDPAWRAGNYQHDDSPRRGLALARAMAVCTYKSSTLFDERFARKPDRSGEDPWLDDDGLPGRFDVSGYLDHQGEKFNRRFDANSYLTLTRMMDLFDPARGHSDRAAAWSGVTAKVTLISISSDVLFPLEDVAAIHEGLVAAGVRCRQETLVSDHGHDAFLAEPEALIALLRSSKS
jgi:homoserine O-acetyltransferase